MCRIGKPSGPIRHIGPRPYLRDSRRKRVDLSIRAIRAADLIGHEVLIDRATTDEVRIERRDEVGMLGRRDAAIVGQRASLPQLFDTLGRGREFADIGIARQVLQRLLVDRRKRARQPADRRHGLERQAKRLQRGIVEAGRAPLQHLHRIELVRLDALDQLLVEGIDAARDAERPVTQVAAGAAGDLGKLGRIEIAELEAVELAVLRKGDVVDIEVEAHADRVRRDEIFDIALLVERDLRIAGTRRKRAQYHRRPAALAADKFGDGIDLVGREGDDGRALRQAGDLLGAGIEQLGKPRALDDMDARQHLFEDRLHGARTQKQRLVAPAQMQHPVGEDMAALQIAGELHLVDGDEGGARLARHGFHRADRKARHMRRDLLLAGDEGDIVLADPLDEARIDLARQKAQRQADNARLMCHHAFDCVVGLARIGRAEHRGDPAAAHNHGCLRQDMPRLVQFPATDAHHSRQWQGARRNAADFPVFCRLVEQPRNETETNR